jgi:hypothetical protein
MSVLQRDGIDEAHLQRLVRAVELAEEPDLARLEMRGAAAWAHRAAGWAHAGCAQGCSPDTRGLQPAKRAAGWMHSRQRSGSSRAFFCPTMRAMCALPYPPSKLPTLGPVWPTRPKEGGGGWRWLTRRRARGARGCGWAPGDPVARTLPVGVPSRTELASAPWGGAGAELGHYQGRRLTKLS